MATISIGRAGRSDTSGNTKIYPGRFQLTGNELRIDDGTLVGSARDWLLALAGQMNGLVDSPDDQVIPIIYDSYDYELTGFYRPISIEIPELMYKTNVQGVTPWAGTFERVAGFGQPIVETILTAPMLANSHGFVGTEGGAYRYLLGLPVGTTEFSGTGFAQGTIKSRTGSEGVIPVWMNDGVTIPATRYARWSVPPSTYYSGSCRLYVGTGTERAFVGRQLSNSASLLGSTKQNWVMWNSLVQVTWEQVSGTFQIKWYDGTSWGATWRPFAVQIASTPTYLDRVHAVRVLLNTPEMLTVRVTMGNAAATNYGFRDIDLTIRRGERQVVFRGITGQNEGIINTGDSGATALPSGGGSAFSSSPGIYDSTTDSDGNRYVIMGSGDTINDTSGTGVGVTNNTAQSTAVFAVTSMVKYATLSDLDDALITEAPQFNFFGGASDTAKVSAR